MPETAAHHMDIVKSLVSVGAKLDGKERTVLCATLIPAARTAIVDAHGNAIASECLCTFYTQLSSVFTFCSSSHRPGYGGMLCDEG